jgi:hypothetical protein
VAGKDLQIATGQSTTIPAGASHFQANHGEVPVETIEEYCPALQMQDFFEVLVGWANDGKTNAAGMPNLLRAAVMHRHFRHSIRSSSARRNLLALLLAQLGVLLGYRGEIQRYIGFRRVDG